MSRDCILVNFKRPSFDKAGALLSSALAGEVVYVKLKAFEYPGIHPLLRYPAGGYLWRIPTRPYDLWSNSAKLLINCSRKKSAETILAAKAWASSLLVYSVRS